MTRPCPEPPAAGQGEKAPVRRKIDHKVLDEIFGDVLPDTTSDERDPAGGGARSSEDWYRENRPPHHGG